MRFLNLVVETALVYQISSTTSIHDVQNTKKFEF